MNAIIEDYEIIRNAGLNGFQKSVEKPVESVETEQKKTIEVVISADGMTYSGTLTETERIESYASSGIYWYEMD